MELKTLCPTLKGDRNDINILSDYINSLREELSFCLDILNSKLDLITEHMKVVNDIDSN